MTADHTPQPEPGDRPVGMLVDGVETEARVDQRLIEETLLPALSAMAARPRARRRAFAFLVGPPGVGKSTLCAAVAQGARRRQPAPLEVAALGIDGFHHPNAYLSTHHLRTDTGSVPLSAIKGAPETFDAWGYAALLTRLREPADATVYAPGFERDLEQPIAAAVGVPPEVRLVVTEGNYLLLPGRPWSRAREALAETWLVEADDETRVRRLVARHVQFGRSPEAAAAWVARSDEANARLIREQSVPADLVVELS